MKNDKSCKICEHDGSCKDQAMFGDCKRYTNGSWEPSNWRRKFGGSKPYQSCGNCVNFRRPDMHHGTVWGDCGMWENHRDDYRVNIKHGYPCADWKHRDGDDPVKKEVKCPKCGRTDEYISESSIDGMSKYFCIICDKWFGGDMDNCGNCKHLKVDKFKGACDGCTTYPKDTPFKHWEAKMKEGCDSCKHRKKPNQLACIKCREADAGVYPSWEPKKPTRKFNIGDRVKITLPKHMEYSTCKKNYQGITTIVTREFLRKDYWDYMIQADNSAWWWHENWLEASPVNYMTDTYMKKYALHPGHVTSITDRQDHYIGYDRLIDLYGLRKEECVSMDRIRMFGKTGEYIHLYPRRDGNYSLPKHEDDPEVIGILAQVNNVAGHVPDYGVEVRIKDYKKAAIKVNGKIELDDVAIKSLREQLIPPFVTDFSTKIEVLDPLTDMERSIMKTDVENEFSSQVKTIKQEFDDRLKDLVDDITDFKMGWINREMDRRKEVLKNG